VADKVKEATPGPWKALLDPGWGWCVKAGKKYLAFKLPTEADAKIMAASWEMLQAIERITAVRFPEKCAHGEESWYCVCCKDDWKKAMAAAMGECRAVRAKARGEER
jgi:hypothetical protein